VVRPGSTSGAAGNAGVVRPGAMSSGAGVVRPGTDVVRPDTAPDGAAKAVAAVPDAPEVPLEPIHIVLPTIPVKPVKQGFLDRLVAGKTDAEKAEEAARKEEEARRKAEEAQRKADEKARLKDEEAQRRADEKAREEAREARREAREAHRAEVAAERKVRAEADEKERKQAEKERREREKAEEVQRREQERLRLREAEELEEGEDEEEPARAPVAPSRPGPPRGAPGPIAPPRPGPPGPVAPPRPGARPRPMPSPDRRTRGPQRYDEYEPVRARRPLWHWAVAGVALVALGGGSAAVAGAIAPPATVVYQAGIDTGDQAPILGGLDSGAPTPTTAGLEAALAPILNTPNLGTNPAVTVADSATGRLLWNRGGDALVKPASSAKILTAAAVLMIRGPNYRIPTLVVAGANPGDVVLVGGGDPTLAASEAAYFRGAARLDELAQQVRSALGGATPSRVLLDGSLFTGSSVGPSGSGNLGNAVANVTALMMNGARTDPNYRGSHPQFFSQPDVAAGRAFASALGVPEAQVVPGSAPAGARVLGEVLSPPISSMVEEMLAESDNTVAEMLARQVALAKGQPATFAGAAQAIRGVLADLGVPMPAGSALQDGSGLSHDNRVTTNHLVAVLLKAASPELPQLHPILSGLAVAGYSGTMDDAHQRGDAGRGQVRAKTGTLAGVNALVGFVIDADGRLLTFAAIGNGTPSEFVAEPALDRIAERLTRCGCG
jgi:D-alanyl-D-alanine carboxypeptidase/D-alanyl-D-alanine-endopeptidase (penicillin-binding protein 4)